MDATKVGIREFRHRFDDYAESDKPVAVTKHGRAVGIYIPLRRKSAVEDLAAFRKASSALYALMAEKGVSEEEVAENFERLRKSGRKARD